MNVNTITVEKEEALTKLAEYRTLNRRQIQPEDTRLRQLYRAVSKGARVLDICEAFKATGCNELGQPKLALAQADWANVTFRGWNHNESGLFTWKHDNWGKPGKQITFPAHTFPGLNMRNNALRSAVPHIPPSVRPKIALSNFHILFEVEKWEAYPVDPFLLRHISGYLYVVVAEWLLTDLESSLLASMRSES